MIEINHNDLLTFYTERCLEFEPKHFVQSKTCINNESLLWIYTKLAGRFCLVQNSKFSDPLSSIKESYPSFEDPAEAIFYELTWA